MKLSNRFANSVGAAALSLLILFSSLFATPTASYAATPITVGGKAVVTNTDGDNINVREGAGVANAQVAEAHEGEIVTVLAGPKKDSNGKNWYKIQAPDGTGWVRADFLEGKSNASSTSSNSNSTPKQAAKLTGFAKVANTDGDPLRMRSAASKDGKVITTLAPDTSVAIKQGPLTDADKVVWYQVSANGVTGWVMGQYLVQSQAPSKAATEKKPATQSKPVVEAKPAVSTEKPVATKTEQKPATKSAPEVNTASETNYSSRGEAIVSTAMKYLGYRYRYGGTTPNGFDCSGFAYYVYNKVGVKLSRDMNVQINSGTRISRDNLMPGDLLFWSNTYKRGLSHVGIYIGNGKFIHAENESTGVVISSLNTAYWASRYTGATRPR
ncbi:MAG TPA: NlpC/P60 family protein [Chloroflexia bacterium]|nr:NlpC/P60 family protein [Chloroflexia bacterium]